MSEIRLPELRFSEFEMDWRARKFSTLFEFKQGFQVPIDEQYFAKTSGLVRFIRIVDITKDNEPARYISDPGESHLVQPNDLFMIRYGTPGVVATGYNGVIANNLFRLMWNSRDEFISYFWYQLIKKTEPLIARLSGSSSMPAISFGTLKSILISFPSSMEQKKIAAFLSAVDTKLAAVEVQLAGWRDYKRGMMQALFSQTLRFKADDGSDFPDWETTPLRKIAKRSTSKNSHYEFKRILSNSAAEGIVDQTSYFERSITTASNLDGYYIVKLGDFVYNPRVSKLAPVGPISRNNIADGIMSPLYTVFTPASHAANYLEVYFKSNDWNEYVHRVSNVGARHDRMNILTSDFMDMPINLPSLPEQQKIVNALKAIDVKVQALNERLGAIREFKRGLLQKMFV